MVSMGMKGLESFKLCRLHHDLESGCRLTFFFCSSLELVNFQLETLIVSFYLANRSITKFKSHDPGQNTVIFTIFGSLLASITVSLASAQGSSLLTAFRNQAHPAAPTVTQSTASGLAVSRSGNVVIHAIKESLEGSFHKLFFFSSFPSAFLLLTRVLTTEEIPGASIPLGDANTRVRSHKTPST